MKDVNVTLWTSAEIDNDEVQDKFVKFLDTLEEVDQYEVTVEEVESA